MSAQGGRLRLKDGLRVASVGLRARPLRAALSALGIAIGTAAIVAVLGLSSSSQAGLLAEIDRLGTNMLTVEAGMSLTGGEAQLPLDESIGLRAGSGSFALKELYPRQSKQTSQRLLTGTLAGSL